MKRNTFTRIGGSTYTCDTCHRLTRNTGAQGLGCHLCPMCFELAGIENEISDGYVTAAEKKDEVLALASKIVTKGGTTDNFSDLLELVTSAK